MKVMAMLILPGLAVSAWAQGQERGLDLKAQTEREKQHEARLARWAQRDEPLHGVAAVITDFYMAPRRPATREQILACQADTIAIVSVVGAKRLLSQRETFVWTDYEVETLDTIKGNLAAGQQTTITQIGGAVEIAGEMVGLSVNSAPSLVVGNTYLAFLEYLPASDDYSPRAIYEMQAGGVLRELYQGVEAMTPERSSEAMASVRSWGPCKEKGVATATGDPR